MNANTGQVIASCFALAAFAVALLTGLARENAAAQILQRGVLAMCACYPVGLIVGMVCDGVVRNHVAARLEAESAAAAESDDAGAEGQLDQQSVRPEQPAGFVGETSRAAA